MNIDLGQRARRVSDDLSAIFPRVQTERAEPRPTPVAATDLQHRSSKGTLWSTIGLLAAISLLGVAVGAGIVRPLLETRVERAAAPAVIPRPAEPLRLLPLPSRASAVAASVPPAVPAPKPIILSRSIRSPPSAPAPSAMEGCSRVSSRDYPACAHAVMMGQDRDLRRAYARAVDAGVPRDILTDSARRWSRLRRQAVSQPARAAAGYAALRRDLARQASRHHARRR